MSLPPLWGNAPRALLKLFGLPGPRTTMPPSEHRKGNTCQNGRHTFVPSFRRSPSFCPRGSLFLLSLTPRIDRYFASTARDFVWRSLTTFEALWHVASRSSAMRSISNRFECDLIYFRRSWWVLNFVLISKILILKFEVHDRSNDEYSMFYNVWYIIMS